MAWWPGSSKKSTAKKTVTAVVCAFNEEAQLEYVVKRLLGFKIFDQVVVVNDGSTDKTAEIMTRLGDKIHPIHFEENKGKSYAMVAGVRAATSEVIFFCDADLTSIKKSHVEGVVIPVSLGLADQALAYRKDDLPPARKLTGERALRKKDLLPLLKEMETTKFGVETFLNYQFRDKKKLVYFEPGLVQINKNKRSNSIMGEFLYADEYLKESWEIFRQVIIQRNPKLKKEVDQLIEKSRQATGKFKQIMETPVSRQEIRRLWRRRVRPLQKKVFKKVKTLKV